MLQNKKYQIVYADPPWDYKLVDHANYCKIKSKTGYKFKPCKSADFHYNLLTTEELKSIPVGKITDANSLLFLWATGPKLDVAFEVLSAWGFKYKTVAFVWHKGRQVPGHYTMSECEYCLVAKKGSIPKPRGLKNIRQFLAEKRTIHSKKPDEIRKRIELMFPTQLKIELFARSQNPGWDTLGYDLDKTDIREHFKALS